MKHYQKPALSANDMLCGDCNVKTRDTEDPFIQKLAGIYGAEGDVPNVLDPGDNVFGTDENGCGTVIDTYCKYGPNGQIIFTS